MQQFRRSSSRLKTRISARLITLLGQHRVILCSLSEGGASIQGTRLPLQTGNVILQWMGYESFGTIRWSHPGRCGILFDEPIPHEWVLATRQHEAIGFLPSEYELNRRVAQDWVTGNL